jgi:ABC-type multidrug transport system fused ATPase/permease subunit
MPQVAMVPTELLKLAPGVNSETAATLVVGSVVVIGFAFGHWDLFQVLLSNGPLDSIVRSIFGLIVAYVVGVVIRSAVVTPVLVAFFFIGLLCGALMRVFAKAVDRTDESRNMVWRRLATAYLGPEIIRLEEPAGNEDTLQAKMKQVADAAVASGEPGDVIQKLAAIGGTWLYRSELDAEWKDAYLLLEAYFDDSTVPRDFIVEVLTVMSIGLALKVCVYLVANPPFVLNLAAYICVVSASLMIAGFGFLKGAAVPYKMTLAAKVLREIKKASKQAN